MDMRPGAHLYTGPRSNRKERTVKGLVIPCYISRGYRRNGSLRGEAWSLMIRSRYLLTNASLLYKTRCNIHYGICEP